MTKSNIPDWSAVHTIIFDFDGIFTDNKVYVSDSGHESVRCDRGDGLAFDLLRKFCIKRDWKLKCFILSRESNSVVSKRADKLKLEAVQSSIDKSKYIGNYLKSNNFDSSGLIFLGNDINDIPAMSMAGFSVVPNDSHPMVINRADLVLQKKGGEGFIRLFIELLIGAHEMSEEDLLQLLE